MSQQTLDLTSELLQGMRLSGVKYRRIETSRLSAWSLIRFLAKRSFILSAAARCCYK